MIHDHPGVPVTAIVRLCGACGQPVDLHRDGARPEGCPGWSSEGATFGPRPR